MSTLIRPTATVEVTGLVAPVTSGSIDLDESWAPYGQGTVVVPFDDATFVTGIDPRNGERALIVGSVQPGVDDDRVFDLGVRSRDIDYEAGVATLTLASDEALAQDYAPLADDKTPRSTESSLRAVCDYVLAKIPGVNRNFHPNPSLTTNLDGYTASSGVALTRDAANGMNNGACGFATISSTATVAVNGPSIAVKAGQVWTISHYVRASSDGSAVGRVARSRAFWVDGPGGNVQGDPVTLTTSFQRIVVTATVPFGVTQMRPDILLPAFATTPSEVVWDWAMCELSSRATSYRDVVLDPKPAIDANVTAYWPVTNEITNPGAEIDLAGWTASASTLARETAVFHSGTASMSWTSTGAGDAFVTYATIGVTPGRSYVLSAYLRTDGARQMRPLIRWRNDAGVTISDAPSSTETATPNAWMRMTRIATAPAGATNAQIMLRMTATASGQKCYGDSVMFHEGSESVPWFDGSTPADAAYTYAWSAAANASAATRTPRTERDIELLTWRAGVTAWDFLEPLLTSVNLRLFCDEQRAWRLVPATYSLATVIPIVPQFTTEAVDTISRDPDSPWANGVVVRYLWEDPLTGPKQRIDTAGTPGKVLVVEYLRPYTGPGAAAAILTSISARGRTQEVVALTDYQVTPGMISRITVETGVLEGRIRSVSFDLSTGLMSVASRDQASLTSGMIDMLTGTIDSLAGTIDSLTVLA